MIRKHAEMTVETRENMRGGQGKVSFLHYFKKDEFAAKTRLCAKLTLQPGTSIGMHPHEKEDELFIVLKGTGVADDGKTQATVSAGDAILTGRGESHAIAATGAEPLEIAAIIMCY